MLSILLENIPNLKKLLLKTKLIGNPNAIHLLQQNYNKINWDLLSLNYLNTIWKKYIGCFYRTIKI